MFNLIVDLLVSILMTLCVYTAWKGYGKKLSHALNNLVAAGSYSHPIDGYRVAFNHYRLAYLFWGLVTSLSAFFLFADSVKLYKSLL